MFQIRVCFESLRDVRIGPRSATSLKRAILMSSHEKGHRSTARSAHLNRQENPAHVLVFRHTTLMHLKFAICGVCRATRAKKMCCFIILISFHVNDVVTLLDTTTPWRKEIPDLKLGQ